MSSVEVPSQAELNKVISAFEKMYWGKHCILISRCISERDRHDVLHRPLWMHNCAGVDVRYHEH